MFANVRILPRLLIGFGLLLCLLAGLSGLAVYTGVASRDLFHTVERRKNNEVAVERVEKRVFEARMQIWMALATSEPDHWEKASAAFQHVHEGLADLLAQTQDPARHALADRLRLSVADYEAEIAKLKAAAGKTAAAEILASAASVDELAERLAGEYETAATSASATAADQFDQSIDIAIGIGVASVLLGFALADAERTDITARSLAAGAQKIGDVVTLIQSIAAQTNLLALNATIEAARAGEAGKGFAVVASEVKSLANQTARATTEIAEQVTAIQDPSTETVAAIRGIVQTIAEINHIATAISAAVEEQGAATNEIARNVQEAARGTQEVSATITGVQQAADATGAASTEVSDAASQLSHQATDLSSEVNDFLAGMRAA